MALSSEFVSLVQQEIPEGRQSLSDSHANLEKVAAYCIENFARVSGKVPWIFVFYVIFCLTEMFKLPLCNIHVLKA